VIVKKPGCHGLVFFLESCECHAALRRLMQQRRTELVTAGFQENMAKSKKGQ